MERRTGKASIRSIPAQAGEPHAVVDELHGDLGQRIRQRAVERRAGGVAADLACAEGALRAWILRGEIGEPHAIHGCLAADHGTPGQAM